VLAVWVLAVSGLTSLYARRLQVTFGPRDRRASYPRRLAYGLLGAWVGGGWAHARFASDTDPLGYLLLFVVVFALGLAALMAATGQWRRPRP
jgi:hypothetical protein